MKKAKSRLAERTAHKAHNKGKKYLNGFGYVGKHFRTTPFALLAGSLLMGGIIYTPVDNTQVQAVETEQTPMVEVLPSPTPSPEPSPKPETHKDEIKQYIREVFQEHAEEALIVAECESRFEDWRIGDRNLVVWNGDDLVGDSVGVFQIRTGGVDFNRARSNGMSPDEFRTWMKDYKENIKYAKRIFDRQGWSPWTCKKDL